MTNLNCRYQKLEVLLGQLKCHIHECNAWMKWVGLKRSRGLWRNRTSMRWESQQRNFSRGSLQCTLGHGRNRWDQGFAFERDMCGLVVTHATFLCILLVRLDGRMSFFGLFESSQRCQRCFSLVTLPIVQWWKWNKITHHFFIACMKCQHDQKQWHHDRRCLPLLMFRCNGRKLSEHLWIHDDNQKMNPVENRWCDWQVLLTVWSVKFGDHLVSENW